MRALHSPSLLRIVAVGLSLTVICSLQGSAQGCAPSRFASPILGSTGDVYLSHGTWQVGVAYRHLRSDQLIVGHRVRNDLAPGGLPSVVTSQSVFTSLTYGVTDRLAVTLNAPYMSGTHETTYADGQRHQNTASGLGEMSLAMSYWLRSARSLEPHGNVAVGLGVKVPTGKNNVMGEFWNADSTAVPFPVHQSIELGDGGWGTIVSAQGFKPVMERTYLFGGGSYTLNPKKLSDVTRSPVSTTHWAVPDTWDAHVGISWVVSQERGFSLDFGELFNGTPRRDLIGGRDDGHRLPAIVGYSVPGATLTRGRHTVHVSIPVRAYMDFQPSYLDLAAGKPGGGGLAKVLVLGAYSVRY